MLFHDEEGPLPSHVQHGEWQQRPSQPFTYVQQLMALDCNLLFSILAK